MALRNNTWTLGEWYDQTVAGTGSYYEDNSFWAWGDNQAGALGQNQATSVRYHHQLKFLGLHGLK